MMSTSAFTEGILATIYSDLNQSSLRNTDIYALHPSCFRKRDSTHASDPLFKH